MAQKRSPSTSYDFSPKRPRTEPEVEILIERVVKITYRKIYIFLFLKIPKYFEYFRENHKIGSKIWDFWAKCQGFERALKISKIWKFLYDILQVSQNLKIGKTFWNLFFFKIWKSLFKFVENLEILKISWKRQNLCKFLKNANIYGNFLKMLKFMKISWKI